MDKKKQLKEEYLKLRPDMGIFSVTNINTGSVYIGCALDLRSGINRMLFQLSAGIWPGRPLQEEWKKFGKADFKVETLDRLSYRENDEGFDYLPELNELLLLWKEKLNTSKPVK